MYLYEASYAKFEQNLSIKCEEIDVWMIGSTKIHLEVRTCCVVFGRSHRNPVHSYTEMSPMWSGGFPDFSAPGVFELTHSRF